MASKTSAVADEPVDVLFALHPKFNLLDFAGPLEVLTTALHDANDKLSKAFEVTIAAGEPKVLSEQGVIIGSQVSWKEAHDRLSDFDVLVVLGGNVEQVIKEKGEPLDLITAFSEVQKEDPRVSAPCCPSAPDRSCLRSKASSLAFRPPPTRTTSSSLRTFAARPRFGTLVSAPTLLKIPDMWSTTCASTSGMKMRTHISAASPTPVVVLPTHEKDPSP